MPKLSLFTESMIRQRAGRESFARGEEYFERGGVVGGVRSVVEQARPFLDAGDGRNALVILEAVTDEYVRTWTEMDDPEGEASELLADLDPLWAEALLTADLSPAEREDWAKRFAAWSHKVEEYGVEDAFFDAEAAAVQGRDDPRLVRI